MLEVEFIITEITDTGIIRGNTESGSVEFTYDDLFAFDIGEEIKRGGKVWVIARTGLLSVHCELKKDRKYSKGFLKSQLIKDKYKVGDSLWWVQPRELV